MTDPECTTDLPCGNDEACIACTCQPAGASCEEIATAQCSADNPCEGLQKCENCFCVDACGADAECTADSDCGPSGTCFVTDAGEGEPVCACLPQVCTQPDACGGDGDCAADETCVDCECRSNCTCESDDECKGPLICDGCTCIEPTAGCATGEATAPNSANVTVSGTNITAQVSGNPADCPIQLCDMSVTNDTDGPLTFGILESLPDDPVAPMPIVSVVGAGETSVFEVWANDCTTAETHQRTLFVHDEANGINLGEVPLVWETTLQ